MTTKETIIYEALLLFAKKGFDGVSVREIAKAVGVRESALYKHFKNKDDILTQVIEESKIRITEAYIKNNIPESVHKENITDGYRKLDTESLCKMAWNLFCFFTKDPVVSNFRKLLAREQYNNNQIAKLYNNFFLDGAVKSQSKIFDILIKNGLFRKENPEIVAFNFYSPIFFLFQQFDCSPENEEIIKKRIFTHINEFGKYYKRSKTK